MEMHLYAAIALAVFTALASAEPREQRQAELQVLSELVFQIHAVPDARVVRYTCGYGEVGCVPE